VVPGPFRPHPDRRSLTLPSLLTRWLTAHFPRRSPDRDPRFARISRRSLVVHRKTRSGRLASLVFQRSRSLALARPPLVFRAVRSPSGSRRPRARSSRAPSFHCSAIAFRSFLTYYGLPVTARRSYRRNTATRERSDRVRSVVRKALRAFRDHERALRSRTTARYLRRAGGGFRGRRTKPTIRAQNTPTAPGRAIRRKR